MCVCQWGSNDGENLGLLCKWQKHQGAVVMTSPFDFSCLALIPFAAFNYRHGQTTGCHGNQKNMTTSQS